MKILYVRAAIYNVYSQLRTTQHKSLTSATIFRNKEDYLSTNMLANMRTGPNYCYYGMKRRFFQFFEIQQAQRWQETMLKRIIYPSSISLNEIVYERMQAI